MAYTSGFSVTVGNPTKASDVGVLSTNDDFLKTAIDKIMSDSATPGFALVDGVTATTQSAANNSTKLATTAYADAAGASLTGTTNNTVVTVTAANAMQGEANLTFDGSTLTVTGAADVSGDFTAGTVNADSDTAASDNAAMGYTEAEGLILTGQGSTNDVTIKNDADETVLSVLTGTSIVRAQNSSTASYDPDSTVGTFQVHNIATDTDQQFAGISFAVGNGASDGQARIDCIHMGTAQAADLAFSTSTTTPAVVERMRILSGGGTLVGKTASNVGVVGSQIETAGNVNLTASGDRLMGLNRLASTGDLVSFKYAGAEKGSISTDGSNVAFNTSSDYRLKENIVDLTGAITRLKNLQPRRFNFKETPDVTKDGFIAHEASTIVPEAVSGTKDATKTLSNVIVDADGIVLAEDQTESTWTSGKEPKLVSEAVEAATAVLYVEGDELPEGKNIGDVKTPAIEAADAVYSSSYASDTVWHETLTVPEYQGIDQAKLVPLLTAAIQELVARVETLEAA